MKTLLTSSIFITTLLLLTGCPEDTQDGIIAYLKIKNNSSKDIVYLPYYTSKNNLNDTLLSINDTQWSESKYIITSNSSKNYGLREWAKKAIETKSNLTIFYLDLDTLKNVPWERIAGENIILKREEIASWKELVDNNFEISYP